jgi:hypothetical protein
LIRIRIQHLRLNKRSGSGSDSDPGFRRPKTEKNLQLKKKIIFLSSKIAIYLFQGLQKGRPSYRRSLQPSKENIQHFKT